MRRRAPRTVTVLGVAWGLLFAASSFGLHVPFVERLIGPEGRPSLDYSTSPGSLTPLSQTFIDGILGSDLQAGVVQAAIPPRFKKGSVAEPATRRVVTHPLTNDDAENAYAFTTIPATARSDTRTATRDENDPKDCGDVGGTVWYRFTAPRSMGLLAYTFGTDHPVTLGVFRRIGNAWEAATDPPCRQGSSGNALTWFQAAEGTTYWFQVTAPVTGGNLRFNLDPRGEISLVSKSPSGEPANAAGYPFTRSVNASPDGRFVTFISNSTNLTSAGSAPCTLGENINSENYSWAYMNPKGEVAGLRLSEDTPCRQAFLTDRAVGRTVLLSSAPDGTAGNSESTGVFISANGRFAVFDSDASNLGPEEDIGKDLFFKDLRSGTIEVIAGSGASTRPRESAAHVQQSLYTWRPSISDDGRFIAFQTPLSFHPSDLNEIWDVYVFDRVARSFELVTVSSTERPVVTWPQAWADFVNTPPYLEVDLTPFISPTGRYVVFRSPSPDLVDCGRGGVATCDTNGTWDTFVRDRILGITERVSVLSNGDQAFGPTMARYNFVSNTISADGRYVVFDAYLVDPNAPGNTSPINEVFLRDRWSGKTTRIQHDVGTNLPHATHYPTISRNGRFIAYTNWSTDWAPNLVARGAPDACMANADLTPCAGDIFVYDTENDTTFPVTLNEEGLREFGAQQATVSEDGSIVTFQSFREGKGRQIWAYQAARPT